MLKFKKGTDFDKTFIDVDYVFDVIFWVDTDWVKDIEGNLLYLRNIIAVQREENGKIEICLNVSESEDDCSAYQESMDYFENGSVIEQQIIDYLMKNIDEIKYTQEEKHKKEDN